MSARCQTRIASARPGRSGPGASIACAARQARIGLGRRRRRALATAVGIALAAAMLSAAVVVSFGLGSGFGRAASRAGLADIIARFDPEPASAVAARVRSLPDLARFALRYEATNVAVRFGSHQSDGAVAEVLDDPGSRQGYAVVSGHNLGRVGGDVLVQKGLADAWGIHVGDRLQVAGLGPQRVVGLAEGPDDVAYPLGAPRIYLSRPALEARYGFQPDPRVNLVEIWLRRPRYLEQVLSAARWVSYGLRNLQFVTRSGVRVLLSQAAGIVIDLLVALSLIALLTAGVLLSASARAEVARRLAALGVRRAVGETRAQVTATQALEGLAVSLPAATLGVAAGGFATYAPTARLLTLLNEPPPGASLVPVLAAAWLLGVLLPAAGAAWPAWRAAREPAVRLLRGGDLSSTRGARPLRARLSRLRQAPGGAVSARGAGLALLGARLLGARRARLAATTVTLGISVAFVLLMLALASELGALESDPNALGRRYQLTASLPASDVSAVRRIPGVAAVAPRYEVQAADSFALGQTIDVIAYPGDQATFESPPMLSGRPLSGSHQAEVGLGLAQALGLSPGAELALALPGGSELRLRVSGVISSLDQEGRVAYVPASALLAEDPSAPEQLAIVLRPGASAAAVSAALARMGGEPTGAGGTSSRDAPLVAVLRAILRAVAVVDGLVCLYALIQACALTVFERRPALAVMRACGGGPQALARTLGGAAGMLVVPAAVLGVALERWVFGPAMSNLAEGYASLPLAAGPGQIAAVLAGLALAAALAVAWVTRSGGGEPVAEGLAA
jgi:hypothetical protein